MLFAICLGSKDSGFCNTSFLLLQITSQEIAAYRENKLSSDFCIPKPEGLRISLIQSTKEWKSEESNRIDHGERDHAIREMGHSIKRCFSVSIPESQRGQRRESK